MQDVAEDIARTEPLDDIFCQNYESDPALSWQYFGTVTGVLRQYPAMQWRTNLKDTNDDDNINDNTIDDNINNNNNVSKNNNEDIADVNDNDDNDDDDSPANVNNDDDNDDSPVDQYDDNDDDDNFPADQDDDNSSADEYDCRLRNWFIEAATCSKDMVILMDVSGSMTGFGKTIGMGD